MTFPREMPFLFDIIAARVGEGRAYHFFQNAPAGKVRLRAAIICAFMFVTFCGVACRRDADDRERLGETGIPGSAIEPRSPTMQAAYTLRTAALAANPTSVAALGALAVFLHANDYLPEAAARYEELRKKNSN